MPDINISSIVLSKFSVTIGDEVISEVCMTNNGSRGDIELYTGFAYKDIYGEICYIGDGYGNGYLNQIIGDVLAGEYLCPYDLISVTQEVIDAKKSGKDVKFWASAIPGNSLGKSVTIEIPQEPIFCTQYFRIEDQHRNPLKGVITSPSWDIDLQVPNTGEISLYMEKGITHTVTVYNYEYNLEQTLSFTTCTSQPLIFVLDIPEPCRQYFKVVDSDNNIITDVTIRVPDEFSLSVDKNGELSYNLIKDKVYDIEIIQHHDPVGILIYSGTFTCCAINPLVIEIELLVSNKGKIGTITYEIIKQIGKDEVRFYIPVTNTSDVERCYYVNLYDEIGEFVDKAPNTIVPLGKFAQKIAAGETETITMTSEYEFWGFDDIVGQLLTFKLMTDTLLIPITGTCSDVEVTYELVDDVTIDLSITDIMISVCADNTKGLITKNLQIGLMYSDPTTLTKTDVCGSPIDIINTVSEKICTSWSYPGPFTCSDTAYPADSMFVAYARGFDDEDNEYVATSPIFRSIYGIKHITVKITDEPLEECFIDHPFDPTKCLITEDQWTFVKWTGIGIAGLYVFTTVAPLIKSAGKMLEKSQD